MAKKNGKDEKLNYTAEIRNLRQVGPGRLYLLWGEEDYLREQYLKELKQLCFPGGEDDFSYKRLDGPELDALQLQQAVDALPFMTERSFVELRNVALNSLSNSDDLIKILTDIPDYCTVAFVQDTKFEPDGRLKLIKAIRADAKELHFTAQSQGMLTEWIARRFAAAGKGVELDAAQRLIFISGDLMSRLIPEIEKIAAYAKGSKVTVADVEAVANHIPEADVFEMTELIADKKYNSAMSVLSELLADKADKNKDPIVLLAVLGNQMRRLYGAKLAAEGGLGNKYVMEVCGLKYDFIAVKLLRASRGFSKDQLKYAVALCAETDYRMKSSGVDPRELMKETVLQIAAGVTHG